MSRNVAYLIICYFAILITKTSAQDDPNYSEKELRYYDKVFFMAEDALYQEDFETALENYEIIIESGLNYGNRVFFNAELCSLLTNYQNKSLDPFLSHEEEMSVKDKFYHYWKGRVLMRKYQMSEAEASLQHFLKTDRYLSKEIKEEAKKWVIWTNSAKEAMDHPDQVEINLLEDISTEYAELSPVYFGDQDQMLFLSNQGGNADEFQVYHSYKEGGKKWSTPALIESFGVFTRENANIQLIEESKRLYHYQEDKSGGGIYYSEFSDETKSWSSPIPLDKGLSPKEIGSKFFMNAEQNRIIFTKDVGSKKFPNRDLMQSFRDPASGKWSKPEGISPVINSEFNEDGAYLSPDGMTLYFASEGHESMGGYDIFKSTFDETTGTWSDPENMGFPINSPENEIQFKMNSDQKGGQFISNRLNTLGDYDIFFFWEAERVKIKGRVIDPLTNEPITDAQIYFRPFDYLDMYFFSALDDEGNYLTEINTEGTYKVEVEWDNHSVLADTLTVEVTYDPNKIIEQDFYIVKGDDPESLAITPVAAIENETTVQEKVGGYLGVSKKRERIERLGSKFRKSNVATLENIYFDFGTSQIKHQSVDALVSLKNLLEEKETLSIEIAGHTDNIGADDVNEWLSFNRANAIKSWLTKNGIESERLIAKGYGSSYPIASNDDELDGRELNRRIEIVVQE